MEDGRDRAGSTGKVGTSSEGARGRRFRLSARVSSDRPEAVAPVLQEIFAKGSVTRRGDEFLVEAEMTGPDSKGLNRTLLSRLRRSEKRTRLRARWTGDDGTEESYFDYVLKKTSRP